MKRDNFQFKLNENIQVVRQNCYQAIEYLGWKVRDDLTRENDITLYVPIPDLLPNAPVYFITLYPEGDTTYVVLEGSQDELSYSHAEQDLPKLKAAILAGNFSETLADVPLPSQTNSVKQGCFISYRRYDSADVVGRIYDRLVAEYGAKSIFKDVDAIPLGVDFRKAINEAINHCAVLLVVIGRDWLGVTDDQGTNRLDDPRDFVRLEVEAALRNDIPIIPLLVRNAAMPLAEALPTTLQELAYRNGLQIRADPDFHQDMARLSQALKRYLASP